MKLRTILPTLLALLSVVSAKADVTINATNFPDKEFRKYLRGHYGSNGVITDEEILGISSIDVMESNIASLKGIEYFTALTTLNCGYNQLTSLDVSSNTALTSLSCEYNQLTTLNISKNTALTDLYCYSNMLTSLDVSRCTALQVLDCSANQLTTLNVSGCTALERLGCRFNQLPSLDVSEFKALSHLSCENNQLTTLDVSKNTALTDLVCYNNKLTTLDVSGCMSLSELHCDENQLTSLDVSKNTALTLLLCSRNQLTSLDVSKNTAIEVLGCSFNQLTTLNVSGCMSLNLLECYKNNIKGSGMDAFVESLPTVSHAEMKVIYNEKEGNVMNKIQVAAAKAKGWVPYNYIYESVYSSYWEEYAGVIEIIPVFFPDDEFRNYLLKKYYGGDGVITDAAIEKINAINVSNKFITNLQGIEYFTALQELKCSQNLLTTLDVSKNTRLYKLDCFQNQIKGSAMDAFIESLPNVEQGSLKVIYNENEGNEMTMTQVAAAKAKGWVPYYSNGYVWQEYTGVVEINTTNFPDENFRNFLLNQDYGSDGLITYAEIEKIYAINVSDKSITNLKGIEYFWMLQNLYCKNNQLTSLDVSKNTTLSSLSCEKNQLTTLDVSKNTWLTDLRCDENQLASIDVSKNTSLQVLSCGSNLLTSLDLSKSMYLEVLYCHGNQLTSLDLSKNTYLQSLSCYQNQLTSLNVSECTELHTLRCNGNRLTSLDLSKNTYLQSLYCFQNRQTTLDVSKNTVLQYLYCYDNQLTSLDVSKNTSLRDLNCSGNQLTSLDVSKNTALTGLSCFRNQIKGSAMDALVESLPNTSDFHSIFVIYNVNEGNVMTTTQVAAAKSKNWIPYSFNNGTWIQYTGSGFILGDVNDDGFINVTDIVATVNYIMEKPSDGFNKEAADLNGDGEINVTDIVKMVSIIIFDGNSSSRSALDTES